MNAKSKCKCAALPQVVPGKFASKPPVRQYAMLASKGHPAITSVLGPSAGGGTTYVQLIRCNHCGQLWQVDAWSRNAGWSSYPDVAIKIESEADWARYDDTAVRMTYFAHTLQGVDGRGCATPGCGGMAVIGLDHCANCAVAAKQSGA